MSFWQKTALLLAVFVLSGTVAGNSAFATASPDNPLAIIEIEIQIEDRYDGPRPGAWTFRRLRDGTAQWAVRDDLYDDTAIGWVLLRVDDGVGSFSAAALPLFADEFTTIDEPAVGPAAAAESNAGWHIALRGDRLHIAQDTAGQHPREALSDEEIRVLLPGDTLTTAAHPGLQLTFHPFIDAGELLLFHVFIDFEPSEDGS